MLNKFNQILFIFILILIFSSQVNSSNLNSNLKSDELKQNTHFVITSTKSPEYILDIHRDNLKMNSPFEQYSQKIETGTKYNNNFGHYNVNILKIESVNDNTNPYNGTIFAGNTTLLSVNQALIPDDNSIYYTGNNSILSQSSLNGWWIITQQLIKSFGIRLNQLIQLLNLYSGNNINLFLNHTLDIFYHDNSSAAIVNNYGYPFFTNFNESYVRQLNNQTNQYLHNLYDNNLYVNFSPFPADAYRNPVNFFVGITMGKHINIGNYSIYLNHDLNILIRMNESSQVFKELSISYGTSVFLRNTININESPFWISSNTRMEFYSGIIYFTNIITPDPVPVPGLLIYYDLPALIILPILRKFTRKKCH